MISEMKVTLVCSKCKVEKSTEEFHKYKAMKSGFRSECKDCQKIYRQENKEEIAARVKIYYQNNKEEIAARVKIYYQNNKEEKATKNKIYSQNNPHKRRAYSSKRRASKVQATPTWTSQFQKLQIEALHQEAVNLERLTGVKFHLDHIHPLNPPKIHYFEGEWIGEICGLDLPCNFQLLTGSENCSKSNKFQCYTESEIDMDNPKPWEAFYPVLYIENLESA